MLSFQAVFGSMRLLQSHTPKSGRCEAFKPYSVQCAYFRYIHPNMILRHLCFAVHPVCLILTFSQHLLRHWSCMFKYKLGSNSSEYRGQHCGWRRFWMMKTMFFLNQTFCSFFFRTYASLVKPNNRLHCLHVIPRISITGHENLVLVVYAYFWGASPLLDAEYWHICHQKNHLKTSQVSVCWNKKLVKYWH
jgi:hypothetical protein